MDLVDQIRSIWTLPQSTQHDPDPTPSFAGDLAIVCTVVDDTRHEVILLCLICLISPSLNHSPFCSHRVDMVLKEDVPKLGLRGDEVSVKAGYARNFLYPQKRAVYATEENRAKFKVDRSVQGEEGGADKTRALDQIIKRLTSVTVTFKRHTPNKREQRLHTCVTYVFLFGFDSGERF